MKKILILFLVCGFTFVSFSCNGKSATEPKPQELMYADAEANGFSPERLLRLDSLGESYIADGKAPNMVMLVARHGKIVYDKAYGWKDRESGEKVSNDDIFRIASMSKGIVTVALMTLYEEGKFLLDDPLYYYIPEFKNMKVIENVDPIKKTYTTRDAVRPITIRHLLCHSSGISYGNMSYDEIFIPRTSTLEDITIEETVKRLATRPLNHDPGEKFTYGMSVDVVGYLIEVLSGQPLDEFLSERIFEPLGMNDTYFFLPEDKQDRLVTLYSKTSDGTFVVSENVTEQTYPVAGAKKCLLGGAGLCGTIYDYAKFAQMLLNKGEFNGHRILGRKTVEMMTGINQLAFNTQPSTDYCWGLGFWICSEYAAARKIGTVGEYGWSGMYGTYYGVDPEEDMIYLLFTNANPWNDKESVMEYFHTAVYQALE